MFSKLTLKDPYTGDKLEANVFGFESGIELSFAGYGDHSSADGYGRPIFIELHGGQLTIHVWSDINQEDPTHVITMEKARESLRR